MAADGDELIQAADGIGSRFWNLLGLARNSATGVAWRQAEDTLARRDQAPCDVAAGARTAPGETGATSRLAPERLLCVDQIRAANFRSGSAVTRRIGEQRPFGRAQTMLDAGSGSHEPFASDPSIGNVRLTTDSGWWWRSRLRTRMTCKASKTVRSRPDSHRQQLRCSPLGRQFQTGLGAAHHEQSMGSPRRVAAADPPPSIATVAAQSRRPSRCSRQRISAARRRAWRVTGVTIRPARSTGRFVEQASFTRSVKETSPRSPVTGTGRSRMDAGGAGLPKAFSVAMRAKHWPLWRAHRRSDPPG